MRSARLHAASLSGQSLKPSVRVTPRKWLIWLGVKTPVRDAPLGSSSLSVTWPGFHAFSGSSVCTSKMMVIHTLWHIGSVYSGW